MKIFKILNVQNLKNLWFGQNGMKISTEMICKDKIMNQLNNRLLVLLHTAIIIRLFTNNWLKMRISTLPYFKSVVSKKLT